MGLESDIRSRKQGDAECYVSDPVAHGLHHPQVNRVSGQQVEELQSNFTTIQVKTMYVFNDCCFSYGYMVMVFLREGCRKTSQELRMLSSVTIECQITKIVMNSGSQL